MPSAPDTTDPSADATLLGTAHVDAPVRRAADEEHPPTHVGRYVVVRRLGAGAMGSVYEARDVDLDRAVALKLVRADLSEGARQRMQREALALARLSHPNVVQVYEIGRAEDGRTFIAMELVRGQTLEQWQRGSPRPGWRTALRLYAQAGEGLWAAHAEGLVHRDFKPSNCMLGNDGRVRVVDFGLAKDADEAPDEDVTLASGELEHDALPLTRTGAVVGTPAYMPPEQLGRGHVDATADQFSFCVSLFEALYGERPFEGETLGELIYAITGGRVRSPPREAAVPGWVRRVVVRGLLAEPAPRWPSMRALLDALADDPALRRRKQWAALGVLVLLGGGALGVALALQRQAQQCRGAEAKLEGAWDPSRAAAVEQAILGTGLAYAPDTWARVRTHLDDYAHAWVAAREQACEATRAGEQSAALLDLRMACLDERRLHLLALVDELSRADPEVVDGAVQAATALPGLARCEDADALLAEVGPPEDPAIAEQVKELDARLVEARAKRIAGKFPEGLAVAEVVAAEADRLGYAPLRARAWLGLGMLQDEDGRYDAARTTLERAYDVAVAERMAGEAADAAVRLVYVVGRRLGRYDEAWSWAAQADPWSRATRSDVVRARYYNELGTLAFSQGDYDRARDAYERELALEEATLGPDHPDVARTLHNLGNVAGIRDERAKARGYYERALAIEQRAFGPAHPSPARSLVGLGNVVAETGEQAEGYALVERGHAGLEKALGPEHPDVARALVNLASFVEAEGKHDSAHEQLERALAVLTKAMGPEHPEVALVLINLAYGVQRHGEHQEAREYLERALAIQTKALAPDHHHLGLTLHNLGTVANALGEPAKAREHLERALAIEEKALGPEHPDVGSLLDNLADSARLVGDHEQARAWLERALAVKEKALGPEHPDVATTLGSLGSLAYKRGDRERARDYFARALAIEEKAMGLEHPDVAPRLVELARLLVELGRPSDAIPLLERALALGATRELDPSILATGRFTLARALWRAPAATSKDRARARELATLARTTYADHGKPAEAYLAEVDAWLAERSDR